LRYFLRRARRFVPRFTRAMGLLLRFSLACAFHDASIWRAGLKARPYKTHAAEGTPTGHRFLGNETGCGDEQLGASRNGFVSGWYEHASRRDPVTVRTDKVVRKARTVPGCPSLSSGRKARPQQCPE